MMNKMNDQKHYLQKITLNWINDQWKKKHDFINIIWNYQKSRNRRKRKKDKERTSILVNVKNDN